MHDQSKRLSILTAKEIQAIYGLPQFTNEERDAYFTLDPLEKQQLDQFRNITTAVYFVLQLGYFKAKKQFWLFAIIWAESKSLHNRLISVFSGCVHVAAQRRGVELA